MISYERHNEVTGFPEEVYDPNESDFSEVVNEAGEK